jgi:ABC-type xylose transport system substrate-binding protein
MNESKLKRLEKEVYHNARDLWRRKPSVRECGVEYKMFGLIKRFRYEENVHVYFKGGSGEIMFYSNGMTKVIAVVFEKGQVHIISRYGKAIWKVAEQREVLQEVLTKLKTKIFR